MNKNDKKKTRSQKGLIDPKQVTEYTVYVDTTLMEFLMFKMPKASRNTIKGLLTRHQVAVGGVPVSQYNYPLVKEDVVTVSKTPIRKRERKDLPIIYEDEDIIAIDKPSGLLSVATEREKGKTAYRLVSDYMTQTNKKSRIYVVHRLDEDTSGVLIFAKSAEVRDALQNAWQKIVTSRGYYACVEGKMEKEKGTLKDYLAQDDFQLVYVTKNKTKGKLAITHYSLIQYKEPYSLLDVHIDSGRKNQIRVQLGNIGHYVIGDDKYGEPTDPIKRLGLHAYELNFTNPLNGKEYRLKTEMPSTFRSLFFLSREKQREMAKQIEKKEAKLTRDTRAQTRIKRGKTEYHKFTKRKKA